MKGVQVEIIIITIILSYFMKQIQKISTCQEFASFLYLFVENNFGGVGASACYFFNQFISSKARTSLRHMDLREVKEKDMSLERT